MEFKKRLEREADIVAIKYMVSKEMFCKYSGEILDYRNAIMITISNEGVTQDTQVIHGMFEDKADEIRKKFEDLGFEVEIFTNIKNPTTCN